MHCSSGAKEEVTALLMAVTTLSMKLRECQLMLILMGKLQLYF